MVALLLGWWSRPVMERTRNLSSEYAWKRWLPDAQKMSASLS